MNGSAFSSDFSSFLLKYSSLHSWTSSFLKLSKFSSLILSSKVLCFLSRNFSFLQRQKVKQKASMEKAKAGTIKLLE